MHVMDDDLPGASAPVLSAAILARIHDLNCDYLDLLRRDAAASSGCSLPNKVLRALADLPSNARRQLATVPFTLYSLGFEDQELWRANAAAVGAARERYAGAHAACPAEAFCEIALFHAWHVAVLHPLAARVAYSLPDETAARLVITPLWQLRTVSRHVPQLLLARWPTNPCFWPDLIRFASAGDLRRLRTVQLLGTQLIAAELQAAAFGFTRGHHAAALVQSPRLRARRPRCAAAVP
jgi:hypothetical protein